jgi:hypothetical protein
MPRPTDKQTLLKLSDANLSRLLAFIDSLPDEYRDREYSNDLLNDRDRTIADVICHLHEWHVMMAEWYEVGMSGSKPAIPAEDVTWSTLPVLNRRIYDKYEGTKLDDALAMVLQSHQDVMQLVRRHNDEELFTKKRYSWTGSTSLGAYLISATSSHYDWALKTLRPVAKLAKAPAV